MNLNITSRTNYDSYISNKPVFLWDNKLSGFGVKVNPSGKHQFIIQYRNRMNKSKRESLSPVYLLSLAEAKNKAKELLMERLLNAHEQPLKEDLTLDQLLHSFVDTRDWRPRTREDFGKTVHAFWGDVLDQKVIMFNKEYVRQWYFAEENKARQAYTDKAFRYMKSVFEFAVANDWIEVNPFAVINAMKARYKPVKRKTHIPPAQMKQFIQLINSKYGKPRNNAVTLDMIKAYLLTGMRKEELHNAVIKTVEGRDYLFIASEFAKNKKEHHIPVSTGIRELIHLFDKKTVLTKDIKKTLYNLSDEMGFEERITAHDLRRSTATLMGYLKVESPIISKALNHTEKGITEQVYIQRTYEDTIEAFDAVSDFLTT